MIIMTFKQIATVAGIGFSIGFIVGMFAFWLMLLPRNKEK